MKRSNFKWLILLVVLQTGGLASAAVWTGLGSEPYWDISANWNIDAAPTSGDNCDIYDVFDNDGNSLPHPVVWTLEGGADVCNQLLLGTSGVNGTLDMIVGNLTAASWVKIGDEGGDGTLNLMGGDLVQEEHYMRLGEEFATGIINMTGGSITFLEEGSGRILLGYTAGGTGLINMDDGLIVMNDYFHIGHDGHGHLRMAGGHIIVGQELVVADDGTGKVDLFGGTLETGTELECGDIDSCLIDLSGGKIIVPTASAGNLEGYISSGRIIAYGGRGTVVTEVADTNTVLTGTADPNVMAKAWHQSPPEGEILSTVSTTLSWVAGEDANSHQVYLGTDPSAMNMITADPCEGILSVDFYTDVNDLATGTAYFWRVDEVNDANVVTTGDLWSFATLEPKSSSPLSPEDGSITDEVTGVVLTWEPGVDAVSFNVYLAAGSDDLALVSEAQTETSYPISETLILGQTYRWRIDTTDGNDLYAGLEVSFKAGYPPVDSDWHDGSTAGSLWSDPANWSDGVPGVGTVAKLHDNFGPAVIDADTEAYCSKLELGYGGTDYYCELRVEGGSLTIENAVYMCRTGGNATLTITDGVVNCAFFRAWLGDQWVEMTGGELNCAGNLEIPRSYASNVGCIGVYNLQDGVVRAGDLTLNANENVYCKFNIAKGMLILDGDARTKVDGYIAAGLITAYYDFGNDFNYNFDYYLSDGTPAINTVYDADTDKTTVRACEFDYQADFTADCVVDEQDRDLLVAALGTTTPAISQWDFDMSTDPNGEGTWDLHTRDADNADYEMSGEGTLLVNGALLLDQHAGANGTWDSDLHVINKVQTDDTAALDYWVSVGMGTSVGSSAVVGFRQYLSAAGTQTLELWTGIPPHLTPYEPVMVEGFAADAMVDVQISYDYETDTFDWIATDGTLSQSGTDVPYTASGGGSGGGFTIRGNGEVIAEIDQFTFTIHGSDTYSPYDLNQDRVVDQLDLDILEAEMAQ